MAAAALVGAAFLAAVLFAGVFLAAVFFAGGALPAGRLRTVIVASGNTFTPPGSALNGLEAAVVPVLAAGAAGRSATAGWAGVGAGGASLASRTSHDRPQEVQVSVVRPAALVTRGASHSGQSTVRCAGTRRP